MIDPEKLIAIKVMGTIASQSKPCPKTHLKAA